MTDDKIVELKPKTKPIIPEFITPADIDSYNDEQLDAMIAAIQVRRMSSYHVYKQTKDEKDALASSKAKEKIEKKCDQIIRKLNTIDKGIEDLERYVSELRGLRLQAEMAVI